MMLRTHIAIALLAFLLILPFVHDKILFSILFFAATALPDIDSPFSFLGKKAKFVSFFTKHRSFFHSMTFCLAISVPFLFIFPKAAFPIFFGYSLHLLLDSLTIQGIRFLWPSAKSVKGPIRTGGIFELILFYGLIVADFFLIFPFK